MNSITQVPGYKALKEELDAGLLDSLYEIEENVVTGYTLADAIREGSRHTEQAIGTYVNEANNEVCALSAAALAVQARFGS